jgi:hypothetical protein
VPAVESASRTVEVTAGQVINLSFVVDNRVDPHCDPEDDDDGDCDNITSTLIAFQDDVTHQAR